MSEVSLSIEETNKLRAKLGLKPLSVGPSTDKNDEAVNNYQAERQKQQEAKKRQQVEERIAKAKNKAKLHERLKGESLGGGGGGDAQQQDKVNVSTWIQQSRKREREMAAKRAQEEAEMDHMAVYGGQDLSGIKIGHDVDEFVQGEEKILTLKDTHVLDEEGGDELENVNMVDVAKAKESLENRKRKPVYTGYDDNEFDQEPGKAPGLLPQYDEVISGGIKAEKKKKGFVLQQGQASAASNDMQMEDTQLGKAISLDYEILKPSSDYYTLEESQALFKPLARKKKRRVRQTLVDEDMQEEPISLPKSSSLSLEHVQHTNYVDDDELQAALAKTRRDALVKKTKQTPEELAHKILHESMQVDTPVEGGGGGGGGVTFSETEEFILRSKAFKPMDTMESIAEQQHTELSSEEEIEEKDDSVVEPMEDMVPLPPQSIIEEPLVAKGMAATLTLLRQQGQIEQLDSDKQKQDAQIKHHNEWLNQLHKLRARHERERTQEREHLKQLKRNTHSFRDHERIEEYESKHQQRERRRAEEERQHMNAYKPVVNLSQRDDYGEELTPKEAFRILSYKFHGKTSGKTKLEKRRLKKEEDKQMQQLSDVRVTATGEEIGAKGVHSHALHLLADKQRQTGQAHIVLSSSGHQSNTTQS